MHFAHALFKDDVTKVEAITKLEVIKLNQYTALLMGVEKLGFFKVHLP